MSYLSMRISDSVHIITLSSEASPLENSEHFDKLLHNFAL